MSNDVRLATAIELGQAFARTALRMASDVASFADSVKAANAHTDYTAFATFRDAFKTGAKAAEYADPDSLWSRTWKAAREMGMLGEYPKAATTEATKKAGQRAKAADKVKALAATKTPAELLAEARKALDAGKLADAITLQRAAQTQAQAAQKAAKEKAAAAIKPHLEAIRGAIKRLTDAGDAASLAALAKAALALSPDPDAKPAKGKKAAAKAAA